MSHFTRMFTLLAAILLMAPGALFAEPPRTTTPEGQLFSSLNRERASQGLPLLQWDDALASAARQHAVRMAQLDQMSHQLPGEPNLLARASEAGARFSVVAENVAIGPDPAVIHTMWMHSPGHRANILSPQLSAVGIAVVQGSSGLFATGANLESRSAGAAGNFATRRARLTSHCRGRCRCVLRRQPQFCAQH